MIVNPEEIPTLSRVDLFAKILRHGYGREKIVTTFVRMEREIRRECNMDSDRFLELEKLEAKATTVSTSRRSVIKL